MERRAPKCKYCGFRFLYRGIETNGAQEYDVLQINPWRCENCNAVYELRNPENVSRGYVTLRRPEKGFKVFDQKYLTKRKNR